MLKCWQKNAWHHWSKHHPLPFQMLFLILQKQGRTNLLQIRRNMRKASEKTNRKRDSLAVAKQHALEPAAKERKLDDVKSHSLRRKEPEVEECKKTVSLSFCRNTEMHKQSKTWWYDQISLASTCQVFGGEHLPE